MPEDNDIQNPTQNSPAAIDNNSADHASTAKNSSNEASGIVSDIIGKINEAQNILIALSGDPSVDEISAAIGLSLFLDRLGKRATAIYSGATPNALEFLKPEETLETTIDALQDFVIALNKEKADHLRYKLDGDFVKIYITPYKTRISEEDLEYSYGDFNIDLVLALDVANGVDLDAALREHGRIMHDAVIVNITNGNPGKLGEIEWSDKAASSISEMVAELVYGMKDQNSLEQEEATALLTGIVAATNRFSNTKTTSEAMKMASKLMESGADQQLITKNITAEVENEIFNKLSGATQPSKNTSKENNNDNTDLNINHETKPKTEEPSIEAKEEDALDKKKEQETTLLDDLKVAEASLSQAGAETTKEETTEPIKIDNISSIEQEIDKVSADLSRSTGLDNEKEALISSKSEKIIQPSMGPVTEAPLVTNDGNKYGQMLEDALSKIDAQVDNDPAVSQNPNSLNPAAMSAPTVSPTPEVNGVPVMNYLPLPGDQILPPPPTPPIDQPQLSQPEPSILPQTDISVSSGEPITPAGPPVEPNPEPLGSQPSMQDQVYTPQAADPGAFKIPGV